MCRFGHFGRAASARRLLILLAIAVSAPAPASASSTSGLALGDPDALGARLYGFARMDVLYTTSRLNHPQFPSYVVEVAPGADSDDDINIHPRLSRLGLDVWHRGLAEGLDLGARIELDFQNGGSESRQAVRMRHGYLRLRASGFELLAGQTWQLVSQLYPSVNSDSLMWNTGNAGDRAPQIRLGYHGDLGQGGGIDVHVAALMPNAVDNRDLDGNGVPDGRDSGLPAFEARVGAALGAWTSRPLRLALSGRLGTEDVTLAGADAETVLSWGVFAELDVPIYESWGVRGEVFAGQDLTDVRGGIGQGIRTTGPDGAEAIRTLGFWGELYGAPTGWLRVAVGYGQDDPDDDDLDPGDRSLNQALWAGLLFRPWTPMKVGTELIRWTTDVRQGAETTAWRLNLWTSLSF